MLPDIRTLDMVRSFTESEQAADPVALAEPGCIAAGQRLAGPRTLDMVRSFTQSEQAADPVALAEH